MLPLARRFPSGENASAVMVVWCPLRVPRCWSVRASRRTKLLSILPDTRSFPSGENWSGLINPPSLIWKAKLFAVTQSQTSTLARSWWEIANRCPVGAKVMVAEVSS